MASGFLTRQFTISDYANVTWISDWGRNGDKTKYSDWCQGHTVVRCTWRSKPVQRKSFQTADTFFISVPGIKKKRKKSTIPISKHEDGWLRWHIRFWIVFVNCWFVMRKKKRIIWLLFNLPVPLLFGEKLLQFTENNLRISSKSQ